MTSKKDKLEYYIRLWLSKKITHAYSTKIKDEVDGDDKERDPFELYKETVTMGDEESETNRDFRYAVFMRWLDEKYPDNAPIVIKIIHTTNQGTFPSIVKLIKMLITCITAMV